MNDCLSWRLTNTNNIEWAEWENDDEAVLYINNTGQTILVSLLCISMLELFHNRKQSLNSLVKYISDSIDENVETSELQSSIQITLQQLQQFGAIEQCHQ